MSDQDGQPLLASDAERQEVADRLNTAVGEGRLTLAEFSDRVGVAYAARTQAAPGHMDRHSEGLPNGAHTPYGVIGSYRA